MMDMGGWMSGCCGYGGVIWAVLGLALIVLVVVGIVWLIRQAGANTGGRPQGRDRSAIREVELRYARGEIDREAYQAIRQDLEADGG